MLITLAALLLVGFKLFLARVSRVIGNTYLPNFMVLDQSLIEKWAKNWFLTFDPWLHNIDRLFILNIGSAYQDVYAYQISMSCHVQLLRYKQ